MASGIQEDPKRCPRLKFRLRGAKPQGLGLTFVEVVNHKVQMHLLRFLLPGQSGA